MKKIFTLIAAALMSVGMFATSPAEMTVIYNWANNAADQVGTTILGATGVEVSTVKIHENTDAIPGIKFGSSYVYADGKWIAIKPAVGGFQAGDVLSVSVVYSNSDATKYGMVDLRAADGNTRIWMSDSASTLNGRNAGEPIVQTYTLEANQDSLFLGRYGNTGTFITLLKVERAEGGDTPGTEVIITNNDFPQEFASSFTKDGVTIYAQNMIDGYEGNINGPGSFSTTLGNFTKIEVTAVSISVSGEGWSGTYGSQTWTGNASSVSFTGTILGYGMGTTLKFTIEESQPTTYTLQLVADPEKGSVAVTNLLGSDIIDNGNGNYTVPENAEVTILATPLEGYEFTGWKVGNRWCDFTECGTALNTEDNSLTITMTADVAYKAEFEAAAPEVERELAKIGVNFPTADCPADDKIQMAGTFAEGTMTMEKIVATGWFVSYDFVNAAADDTFKFRDATNNDKVLCKYIPANGDAEGKWVQAIFKFGNYWQADSWKGTPCKLIEEDLSDANQYAWKVGMPEPDPEESAIENISGSTKAVKRIVNGQLVIEHNGKFYNALGAEVK